MKAPVDIFYWRARNREVDFVLRRGKRLTAIEVKSGPGKAALPGIAAFSEEFPVSRKILVGGDGIPLEEFFTTPMNALLE